MESAFWESVAAAGHQVPTERPLAELTTELTAMLGDADTYVRSDIACTTLSAWIAEGVYDDLLEGLGDGMSDGLVIGLGTTLSDTVFRRSYSALVLSRCIERDNQAHLVSADTILAWGDRIMGWLVRERDLRGYVPGKGWAGAVSHGALALEALAGSEHLGRLELTVVLDAIADRVTAQTESWFTHGEDDRLAAATMAVLRRDALPVEVLDPWVARLVEAARRDAAHGDPYVRTGNVQAFLRAFHLQLAVAPHPPACRADLLLSVIDALRSTNPDVLC